MTKIIILEVDILEEESAGRDHSPSTTEIDSFSIQTGGEEEGNHLQSQLWPILTCLFALIMPDSMSTSSPVCQTEHSG